MVPRWGAMTFGEKVENDMVINRICDIHRQKPNEKNFIKLNVKQVNEHYYYNSGTAAGNFKLNGDENDQDQN